MYNLLNHGIIDLRPIIISKPTFRTVLILGIVMIMTQACSEKSITLIADPKVLSIPIQENQEPLVDLKNQKEILYGPSPEIPNNQDYTQLRKTVYEKLVEAQKLLPPGLKFCLYEGYRSLDLQKELFDNRYRQVKACQPNWPHDSIFDETTKLVSPVINLDGTTNTPPHSTGAAVDVYLVDAEGKAVDMGIHPALWMEDLDGAISQTDSNFLSEKAKKNRVILSRALEAVGFVNYPTEYWHWSYGDRYWAYTKGVSAAIYGTIR